MRPVDFEGTNVVLTAPEGQTEDQCESIRGLRAIDVDGNPYIVVAVQPSYEDMQAMQRGEPILIKFVGKTIRPFIAFTLDENGDANV